jgi:hypothetical protein
LSFSEKFDIALKNYDCVVTVREPDGTVSRYAGQTTDLPAATGANGIDGQSVRVCLATKYRLD